MAWLAGAFGVLAMILVTVGLYGIIAYVAVSRRNEIGIRMSLGATRGQIVMLVLRESLWLAAAGLIIGLPLAAAAMRGLRTWLFGLSPVDLPTAAAVRACSPLPPHWRAASLPGARRGSIPTSRCAATEHCLSWPPGSGVIQHDLPCPRAGCRSRRPSFD
jgi:FtsX-like permease family